MSEITLSESQFQLLIAFPKQFLDILMVACAQAHFGSYAN